MSHLIDTTEMYLRTVYELLEEGIAPLRARIAERLHHSGPTVSETVARMERDGLLTVGPDRQLHLSEQGMRLAVGVMRRHRLAERLLTDVIGLDWHLVHDEACRWEHVMSDRVERKIVALLGDTLTESPYGNPIPGLEELGVGKAEDFRAGLVPLSEVAGAQPVTVRVRRIGEPVQVDHEALALLTAAGLLPGEPATVRAQDGRTIAARVGADEATGVSLPSDIAVHVLVERL